MMTDRDAAHTLELLRVLRLVLPYTSRASPRPLLADDRIVTSDLSEVAASLSRVRGGFTPDNLGRPYRPPEASH
jgi:hypothetical protein